MTLKHLFVPLVVIVAATTAGSRAQEARPANIPVHTWVREDIFAGFLDDDLTRFERGEEKVRAYLGETPTRPEAKGWMVGIKLYHAARAFRGGDATAGETLVREAMTLMDEVVGEAPDNLGVHATIGGSIVLLADRFPAQHYEALMRRARTHFTKLYAVQSPALARLPLHIKGELLAGLAETEFRVGDKARATEVLNQIVADMPNTAYAKSAATWLASPTEVTRNSKLVCQSCHEPGRLAAWQARTKPQ
jgi:hypothetical protein